MNPKHILVIEDDSAICCGFGVRRLVGALGRRDLSRRVGRRVARRESGVKPPHSKILAYARMATHCSIDRFAALVAAAVVLITSPTSAQNAPTSASQREAEARARLAARTVPSASAATNQHSFGIFMPREDVFNMTPDVTERIRSFYTADPKDIPLARFPLISDKDIERYDWQTHTVTLDKAAISRIRTPTVWGAPFVVMADGQPVYVGAFYTAASSASCSVPVILTDPFLRQTNTLQIQRAYPGEGVPGQATTDPRTNTVVKNALQSLGKLKE